MKTRATTTSHGHVIILTLIVCVLLGLVLVSVISLSTNEGQMTGRSQSWNGAIPVAEAGIEEAFAHLKYCPTNRASNGWTLIGDHYTKFRPLSNAWYEVTISTNYEPTIIARGGIRAPGQTNYLVRTVRVTATNEPMFSAAIEATDGILFKGSGVTINSYDSTDLRFSGPDGRYDPAKFKDQGKVVCHYGSFDMGNAKIYGHVETGEESALTIGPGGVVGSILHHLNVGRGIEDGWHTGTTSSEIFPVDAPLGGTNLPPRVGSTYTFTNCFTNAIFRTNNLAGDIVVKSSNHVTLIVQANTNNPTVPATYGVRSIVVEPGASLKLYVDAGDVALKGIQNKNLRAESFMYYGLSRNINISMQGNASFTGILFAPNAALSIGGGGNDEIDFLGAIIARTVTVNGKMTFHFDEATKRLGSRGFIANRWDEL
jgi:hypothetical protein